MKMSTPLLSETDLQQLLGTAHWCRPHALVPNVTFTDGAIYLTGHEIQLRSHERAPDYRAVAAWSGFLLLIGAAAFALGMAIHNESLAKQRSLRPAPIYYCMTGVGMPVFVPCRAMKGQRNI
jgi:hypothetical protein